MNLREVRNLYFELERSRGQNSCTPEVRSIFWSFYLLHVTFKVHKVVWLFHFNLQAFCRYFLHKIITSLNLMNSSCALFNFKRLS